MSRSCRGEGDEEELAKDGEVGAVVVAEEGEEEGEEIDEEGKRGLSCLNRGYVSSRSFVRTLSQRGM